MKKSIFILFLLLFSANISAQNKHENIALENDTIFHFAEVPPEFPGGISEMMRFIIEHLRIPSIYRISLPFGRVIVRFVVERDGSLTNIEVVRGVSPRLDAEAVRVVELMPKWTPGKQNGKPVRVRFTLPIMIRLSV